MKDPKDEGTKDWVEASALKSRKGELQLPLVPRNFLNAIALHCITEGRDDIDLVRDINEATCFWLQDHYMRTQPDKPMPIKLELDS